MIDDVRIEVSSAWAGLNLRRELVSGRWVVEGWGREVIIREWKWGERRRLLQACGEGGTFDADRFVRSLVELVCDPTPPAELHPLYAHVALSLYGITGSVPVPRIGTSELALSRDFGWRPSALDGESAVDLDRLLQTRSEASPGSDRPDPERPDPGWKRLVFEDDRA